MMSQWFQLIPIRVVLDRHSHVRKLLLCLGRTSISVLLLMIHRVSESFLSDTRFIISAF